MGRHDSSASAGDALDRLLARPSLALALLCLAQLVLWTLAPALSHDAPPVDIVEGYMWGRERVLATYKHPALPAWLLEGSRVLTGAVGWPAYLISQACISLTFLAVYLLGRKVLGPERALAGTLLLTAVFYFSWPTPELNHNVVQMPLWAGVALALWKAGREEGGPLWWLLLGVLAVLSLYAKLSSAVLLLLGGVWLLWDPVMRRQLATPWPWIALTLFAALVAPLAIWLIQNDFQPLSYAHVRGSIYGRFGLFFIVEQALVLAGLILMLWAAGLLRRPEPPSAPGESVLGRYLVVLTLAPIAITVLGSLMTGVGVKGMWGAPMLSFTGLIAVSLLGAHMTARALRRIALAAAVLLVALPLAYAAHMLLEGRFTGRAKRQNWPQQEIAARLHQIWREATGQPLRIVAGETSNWVPSLVGLSAGPGPSLLTMGDLRLAPWVTPERLAREGLLVVWQQHGPGPPPPLVDLVGDWPRGTFTVRAPRLPKAAPIIIGYAIKAPR
jgi:hypothetical protein